VDIFFSSLSRIRADLLDFLAKLTELFSNEEFIKLAKHSNLNELLKIHYIYLLPFSDNLINLIIDPFH
jgi:hypothetical protein